MPADKCRFLPFKRLHLAHVVENSLVQQNHDGVRCGGVESGCRLVQVEHGGRDDELHADVGALSLPARHTPNEVSSDLPPNFPKANDCPTSRMTQKVEFG